MRRILILLVSIVLTSASFCYAMAESKDDWANAPVISKAYEQSFGKIYVEWKGQAPVYQIYVDGSKVADVSVCHYIINVEKGTHSIIVYPIYEIRDTDTKMDLSLGSKMLGELSIDLASLGLDPKRLAVGNPSEVFLFDYKPSQIVNGIPENISAVTDPENRVILSFTDQYVADEYLLTIKHRNDINYLTFRVNNESEAKLITKTNTNVSLVLDPSLLRSQDCFVPELNEEYRFTIQLRKYVPNLVNGEKEKNVIIESKVSGEFAYKVTAAWKNAPVITYASQSADGEITLKWDHEDYDIGCEYVIMRINKVFGIMTGEEELGRTSGREFSVTDLNNGSYCMNIVPMLKGEKGFYSADANVEIKNEWVIAPELNCEQIGDKEIKLTWKASSNIEKYHVIVFTGDNASLLRFVDLDYSKYEEFDINANEGEMEYIFTYDKAIDIENGIKLKFEVYGLHYTVSGGEQKSATSTKTIVLQ